jgi:hypothetical protein
VLRYIFITPLQGSKVDFKEKEGAKIVVIRNTNIEQQTKLASKKQHCELYCFILMLGIFCLLF